MREFNTTGPCNPDLHYTVMRQSLIEAGKAKVHKGQFFTIFAPRQSGKTTYFQLLLTALADEGFTPIWISFEMLSTLSKKRFYQALTRDLQYKFAQHGLSVTKSIKDALGLADFFDIELDAPIVLVIDEFEGIPNEVLSEVMHTFREIYHEKARYALHALILVGVSTIAELVVSTASPFNIAAEMKITYFTFDEVHDLINQYVTETGHPFEPAVIKTIYQNTQGQPGLVCALCLHLVSHVVTDRNQPVTMDHFYETLQYFLTRHIDKNIINIVQKAREKRDFMLKLLFQPEPISFSLYDPDIAWLYANGVVDEIAGDTDVTVPLYKKVLVTAFKPLINGEAKYYLTSAQNTLGQYLTNDGLNVNALLNAYRAYIQRRGFRAFDRENLKEAAFHYSLDGFLNFFIDQLEGQTYVEVPSGRGRVDLLIRHQTRSYIIEIKLFSRVTEFERGKAQLAAYLTSEGLVEGYYVVFSNIHQETDILYSEETIDDKRIFIHIILIDFEQPSRLPAPDS